MALRKEGVEVGARAIHACLVAPPPLPKAPQKRRRGPKGGLKALPPLPALPESASVAARVLWDELKTTRERIRDLPEGSEAAAAYASLSRVLLGELKQLDEMIPPAPPDPSKDPQNIAAREMVHAHVLRAVEGVEARDGRLCPRCGREVAAT